MKKKLFGFIAAALIAFSGSAYANKVTLGVAADPVSLDIHVQLSGEMLAYSHLAFDPLVRWTKQMDFEPRLAKSWERVDDLTMRFKLRKGVKFHSGNSFTAKDVVWTIDRLKKSQDFKGLFEPFTGAEAVDEYTVDIKTKEPYGLVLNMMTYVFPMDSEFYTGKDENGKPKDAIVKVGESFANTHQSGTGPFYVTYREQGVKTVFKRFDEYWDKDCPGNVEELVMNPIKKDSTRVASLLSGDVDFIYPVTPQNYKMVKRSDDVKLVTMGGSRIITFQMNQKRRPEFANKKVRQAMVYAVNNEGIVEKIMKGEAVAAGQQGPEGFGGYVEELKPRYDLDKAKKLMKEAGYENGFECTMAAPNNRYVNDEKIAEAVAAMLSKINIKVNLKTMPKAQYWPAFDERSADIQMIGWHPDTEDSANYSEYLVMCPSKETGYGQYNSGMYCNEKVDELIMKCQTETDPDVRNAMLKEVERTLYNEAAFMPLHWQNLSWAGKNNLKIEPIINMMNFPYFGELVVK
jgi:peptide/nickel transport system substrate-binding protein